MLSCPLARVRVTLSCCHEPFGVAVAVAVQLEALVDLVDTSPTSRWSGESFMVPAALVVFNSVQSRLLMLFASVIQ